MVGTGATGVIEGKARHDVSVVVPARNAEHVLGRCLSAIAAGTLVPREVVVVDDASSDATAEIAAAHGATVIRVDHRMGPGRARNLGAQAATGALLCFLDSDVEVTPDALRCAAGYLACRTDAGAVVGVQEGTVADANLATRYKAAYMAGITDRAGDRIDWVNGGRFMVRRPDYIPMRADIFVAEDVDWGMRFTSAGRSIHLIPHMIVRHLHEYTVRGLLANAFAVARAFSLAGLERRHLSGVIAKGFAHVTRRQLLATPLSSVAVAAVAIAAATGAPLALAAAAAALVAACGANRDLYARYVRTFGVARGAGAVVLSWLEDAAFCVGVTAGATRLVRRGGLAALPGTDVAALSEGASHDV